MKKLYARGEITREQYREALERLEQGAFTLTDLWELRRPKELEKSAAKSHGSAPAALKQKWEQVSKAEEEIHSTIKASTGSLERLNKEMQRLEELARTTLKSNEEQARTYLEQRQTLAEQVSELESRIEGLKADSVRLNLLKVRLEAKIAEQEVLVQGDVVSRLEKELNDLT